MASVIPFQVVSLKDLSNTFGISVTMQAKTLGAAVVGTAVAGAVVAAGTEVVAAGAVVGAAVAWAQALKAIEATSKTANMVNNFLDISFSS